MQALAQKASRTAISLLFPDTCLACRMHVAERGTLCPGCWGGLHLIAEPLCDVTGSPFQHDFGENAVSAEALANPPPWRRARAAAVHNGIARQLVQRLKYGDRTELAPWMARWMARAGASLVPASDVIVPIPLHRRRYLARRYNQSAELARGLSRHTGVALASGALARVKSTRQQVGLTANDRRRNVRGAFAVPDDCAIDVAGRSVLLVDDVFTTGATVEAATKALMRAGASAVDVLTFSRVVPHFSD